MHRPFHAITMLIGALAALLFLVSLSQPTQSPSQQIVLQPRPYVYVSKWKARREEHQQIVTPVPATKPVERVVADDSGARLDFDLIADETALLHSQRASLETTEVATGINSADLDSEDEKTSEQNYKNGCGRDQTTGEVYEPTTISNASDSTAGVLCSELMVAGISSCGAAKWSEVAPINGQELTAGEWWQQSATNVVDVITVSPRLLSETISILAIRSVEWSSDGVQQMESLPLLAWRSGLQN